MALPKGDNHDQAARESRDPRTYNQPLPDVPAKDHIKGKVLAYGTGYQDAVNETVGIASDHSGKRALSELGDGNPKPYRRLAERRKPIK